MVQKLVSKIPDTLVILFLLIVVAAILTWVVPAGSFEYVEVDGTEVIEDVGSFAYTEQNPQGITDVFLSIPEGGVETGWIIVFCLIVGGAVYIFQSTRAIDSGVIKLADKIKGKEYLVIVILMVAFALMGATYGAAEESIAFMLVLIPMARKLGYDSITGAAIGLVGMGTGFAAAMFNPFTVGVAQEIAGVPMFSGAGFRTIFLIVQLAVAITFVVLYANKVKKNPEKSLVYDIDKEKDDAEQKAGIEIPEFAPKHMRCLLVLLALFIILPIGVGVYDWGIYEIMALFLVMGILGGLLGGLNVSKLVDSFGEGARYMAYACLLIMTARGILVILREGGILDTIVMALSVPLGELPAQLSGVAMILVQTILNFIIPSGSGQAAVTTPIMAPLSDIIGLTRQTAVFAYQIGDGFSNIFWPTSGYFIAALGVARIPWDRWARWILPLMGMFLLVSIIFMIIAVQINYA